MAAYSNILAWRILQREEPGRLQSIGLHRVGHHWNNSPAHSSVKQYMHLVEDLIMLLFYSCSHLIHGFRCPNCLRQSNSLFCFLVLFYQVLILDKRWSKIAVSAGPRAQYILPAAADSWSLTVSNRTFLLSCPTKFSFFQLQCLQLSVKYNSVYEYSLYI